MLTIGLTVKFDNIEWPKTSINEPYKVVSKELNYKMYTQYGEY